MRSAYQAIPAVQAASGALPQSCRESASHELRMPDRHAQRNKAASCRFTVTSAPDFGSEHCDIGRRRPATCAIDPSLPEISCDTSLPLDRADII